MEGVRKRKGRVQMLTFYDLDEPHKLKFVVLTFHECQES